MASLSREFELWKDTVSDVYVDTVRNIRDFTGPFDIEAERLSTYSSHGDLDGVVNIRRHVPQVIGAVLLMGGYVDGEGAVTRSPSAVHEDTERILGKQIQLPAETVLSQDFLEALSGKSISDMVSLKSRDTFTLRGGQVNTTISLLEKLATADDDRLTKIVGSSEAHRVARTLQKPAARLVEAAKDIDLLKRTGVQYGRPLVRKKPQRTPDEALDNYADKIPEHLLKRARDARAKAAEARQR